MAIGSFNLGDRVKDEHTGRHGTVVKLINNSIIPGLLQAVIEFDNPSAHEILYFTRLSLVENPVLPSLAEVLADLALEQPVTAPESDTEGLEPEEATEVAPAAPKRPRGRPRKVTVEPAE